MAQTVEEITLRGLRQRRGSIGQVSRATGLARSQISRYERGLAVPRLAAAKALAEYLGITPEEVMVLAVEEMQRRKKCG